MAEAGLGVGVLDALVAVARRHGVDTTAEAVRRRFVVQDGPIGNTALIALASEIGLQARALRVGWSDLPRFANVLPAILRLKDGAALVLEAVVDDPNAGRVAVVSDPSAEAEARALVDEIQLNRVWDGELILIKRRFDRTDETQPFGLGWLLGQVLRERVILRDIALGSLMSTLFAIAPPFIAMIVLDRVIVNQSTSTLYVLAGVLVIVIFFDSILGFLRRLFMETAATRIDGRLNLYVLDRLLRLPMEYFERTPAGETDGQDRQDLADLRLHHRPAALHHPGHDHPGGAGPDPADPALAAGLDGVRLRGPDLPDHLRLPRSRSAAPTPR